MKIHREGYRIILSVLLIIAILLSLIFLLFTLPAWLSTLLIISGIALVVFTTAFFRAPARSAEYAENKIFSGADGKIVAIEVVTEDEYFQDKRMLISVFMSATNVHVNFAPLSGIVKYVMHHPGKYLLAWLPKSSVENERNTLVIENPAFGEVMLRQIAGAFARRIVCYPTAGSMVEQGKEFGIIKFGSRVDVLLPLNTKIHVALNQHVKGGVTVLASMH
jgi:phosphatidylserine decarboxylase